MLKRTYYYLYRVKFIIKTDIFILIYQLNGAISNIPNTLFIR